MTCGFSYPYHESSRHYLKNRLVCPECDDLPTQSDYMQNIVIPFEKREISEQPVSCQGSVVDSAWYSALWYESVWYGDGHECDIAPAEPRIPYIPPLPTPEKEKDVFSGVWTYATQTAPPPAVGEIRSNGTDTLWLARRDGQGYDRSYELGLLALPARLLLRDDNGVVVVFELTSIASTPTYYTFHGTILQGDPNTAKHAPILVSWYGEVL
jgi:hypothetical protein